MADSQAKPYSVWLERFEDRQRYKPLTGAVVTEVAVIGAGIAGVMAAWNLVKAGKKVVLIEKNHVATGDSSATTGFLTRVPDTSVAALTEKYGAEFTRSVFAATREVQQNLFALIKDKQLGAEFKECASFYGAYEAGDELLAAEWKMMEGAGADASLVGAVPQERPFAAAVRFANEGSINIRQLLFSILALPEMKGVQVYEETEVTAVEVGEKVLVRTLQATITADKIVVTMGNPGQLFPELETLIHPRVSYVLAAEADDLKFGSDLCWDTRNPYFYYRLIGPKTIMVGGADIAFDKTNTQVPFAILETFLRERLTKKYAITHRWSGSLFETVDGLPYVFLHPHYGGKVAVATGFGGNGLIFGTLAGAVLAGLVTGQAHSATPVVALKRTGAVISVPEKKTAGTAGKAEYVQFGTVTEFGKRTAMCRMIGGHKVAVFKVGDTFHAIHNVCSHAGGSLADGSLEGRTVQCPLHGAKFDVTTGKVVGLPATRSQNTYPVRVVGDRIEVLVDGSAPVTSASTGPKPSRLKHIALFALGAGVFWLLHFLYNYYHLNRGDLGTSLVLSFAFAGEMLFSLALLMSAIFRWWPRTADYWRLRRYMGVSGFILISLHVFTVLKYLFQWQTSAVFYSFNPLQNPVIFGVIALPLFMVMAFSSTDWAVDKLTPTWWKRLHRVVYVAYLSSIFHFSLVNPSALKNPEGWLLIAIVALALGGQLFWFIKISAEKKFRKGGFFFGAALIILAGIIACLAYK